MMGTAWIAGASGLVGNVLLQRLLEDPSYERIISFARRPLAMSHPKLSQVTTDFASLDASIGAPSPDAAFGCLGTTIKKAGSQEAFRKVDHDAVLSFARAALQAGPGRARVFVHVTALGANPDSRIFYNAVKGEVERDVAAIGFPSVYALRPSFLDGARAEQRRGEHLALAVGRALGPVLGKYRPTPVDAVARVMIACARDAAPGAHVVEANAILGG